MLTIAICDDNPIHCKRIEDMLKEYLVLPKRIEIFFSPNSLRSAIEIDQYKPELVMMDIEMDEMNGIEMAQYINKAVPDCQIIFITAYERYAPEVYRAEHTWFVPKTQAEKYLKEALNKALNSKNTDTGDLVIHMRTRGKSILLPVNTVIYLEREGKRTTAVTTDGQYTASAHPDELLSNAVSKYFIRCHQSYWLNRNFIDTLEHDQFILKNGERIQLGRTFRLEARQAFFNWLKTT